ncbi:MAG: hypothetical protein AB7S97_00830 [Thermoplasmata archaeon]
MTRHSGKPSKKMVPSLSNDRKCEHRFTEGDSMTLEVDCGDCSGGQSIENPKCASGITNILALGVIPDAVVLKRHIHVRYRSDRITRLCESASALAALRRLEAQPAEPSDRRCRTCPASRQRLASEVIRRIQADPVSFGPSRKALSDMLASEYAATGCPRLSECIAQVVEAGLPNRGTGE